MTYPLIQFTIQEYNANYIGQTIRNFNTYNKVHIGIYRNKYPERLNFSRHLFTNPTNRSNTE